MIMPQSTEDSISKLIENKFYSSKKFAEEIEKMLGESLRKKGLGVWYN